jgi:hypothetical protein
LSRVGKRVINLDHGGSTRYITCGWADCELPGYENNKIVWHEHVRTISCDHYLARHISYVFCTERHRQYWINSTGEHALRSIESTGRAFGNLPVGSRGMII